MKSNDLKINTANQKFVKLEYSHFLLDIVITD